MYKEIVDPAHEYRLISLDELAQFAKAPRSNCILSTKKLEDAGVRLPEIHGRVKEILQQYKQNLVRSS